MSAHAGQRLVVVGGGIRPPEANERFVDWAGGKSQARILVLTWAAPPSSSWDFFDALREELDLFAPEEIVHGVSAGAITSQRAQFVQQLARATGVYFTGGDQNRVMDLLDQDAAAYPGKRSLLSLLQQKYQSGTVFGGTSAGTAIMSNPMLTGQADNTVLDGRKVGIRPGLGFISNVIFDQHFLANLRTLRLMGLMFLHPGKVGLGIDEDTALLIQDSRYASVVGTSKVLAMELNPQTSKVETLPLTAGQRFDLVRRTIY
ncbi:cyanophycinase [bacterium]|nr:cyanophycinase [bacterium]